MSPNKVPVCGELYSPGTERNVLPSPSVLSQGLDYVTIANWWREMPEAAL